MKLSISKALAVAFVGSAFLATEFVQDAYSQ